MSKKLKVAIIAPPWLKIPPQGYGGIEKVIHGLVAELPKLGVKVEVFSTGDSRLPAGVKNHWIYPKGDGYQHIHKPLYESGPIAVAQVMFALNTIRQAGDFDIIHDHNGFIGPAAMAYLNPKEFPPAVHTLHGPPFSDMQRLKQGLPDDRPMWRQLAKAERFYIIPISGALGEGAPRELKHLILPAVHNAIEVQDFAFQPQKSDYFITLARFSREKGQATAAKLCDELGVKLKMAGPVAGITSPRQMILELANPLSPYRAYADFKYYSDKVLPLLVHNHDLEYVGNVDGEDKIDFIGRAKALLFPIDWEEPFGMAPIEALACGTPVVAMNRGAMPEIIKHGVNGFLAKTEAEFKDYMKRVDEIDPKACRASVETNFSAAAMAQNYLDRYRDVIARSK